jgi:hypothetical protein
MKLASLKTWLVLILILSFLTPAINAILGFLGVDKSSYEAYLLWGNALVVVWFVLDEERSKELLLI